jgi:hypothetical protein
VTDLAFYTIKISSQKLIYVQKPGQNTGEEAQTLLSKKDKNFTI